MKLIAETCGPLNSRFLIDLTGFSHHPFQSEAVADEDGADLTIGATADWIVQQGPDRVRAGSV